MADKKQILKILGSISLSPNDNEILNNLVQLFLKKQEMRKEGISISDIFTPESLEDIRNRNLDIDDEVTKIFEAEKIDSNPLGQVFVVLQDIDSFGTMEWMPWVVLQNTAFDFMKQSVSLKSIIGISDKLVSLEDGEYIFATSNMFLDSAGYNCFIGLRIQKGTKKMFRKIAYPEHKIQKINSPYKIICLVD